MSPPFDISFTAKRKTALTVLFALVPFFVQSQTNSIRPTVTVAMGDVGGKLHGHAPDPAKTQHYYIAAERQLWDYAPEGRDVVCGMPLPAPILAQHAA